MADNEKDLQIQIGADIKSFLKQLDRVDEAFDKQVSAIEKKKAEIKLKTSVDISNARALGDTIAEITARNRELNDLVTLQTRKTDLLKKNWQDIAKNQNASKQQIERAYKQYANAQISLNKLLERQNRGSFANNLSILAPGMFQQIEKYKNAINAVGAEVPAIGAMAPALGTVAAGFAAAGAAAAAYYKILDGAHASVEKAASDMAGYGEQIYKLKEWLGVSGQDAIQLNDIFKLDGTNVDGLIKAFQTVNKALLTGNEEGNKAAQALAKYGESLKNADGSLKNFKEQSKAVADAYAKAMQLGDTKGLELLTEVFGSRGASFTSFFSSFEQHSTSSQNIVRAVGDISDAIHAMDDEQNRASLQTEEIAKLYQSKLLPYLMQRATLEKKMSGRQVEINRENADGISATAASLGELNMQWVVIGKLVDAAKEKMLQFGNASTQSGIGRWLRDLVQSGLEKAGGALGFDVKKMMQEAKSETDAALAELNKPKTKANASDQAALAAQRAQAEATAKVDRELAEMRMSDYEKELAAIQKEVDAHIAAGADKIRAEELYQAKKAELDKRYAEKYEKDVQAHRKAVEAKIRELAKEVEATRKAEQEKRKAAMSEAESTLLQRKALIRKMQKEEAAGGDWQARVQDWAERQYMKQNGLKSSDVAGLQRYGVEMINKFEQGVKDKLYGFAAEKAAPANTVNNNNNTTINIDRPVLTDESLINQLADRVAEKLVPVAQNAFKTAENAY